MPVGYCALPALLVPVPHLPVVANVQGEKLSKQTLAQPAGKSNAVSTLFDAMVFLRQQPPAELRHSSVERILEWAIANWHPDVMLGMLSASQPD